jgi:hypothetical protein
MEKAVHVGMWRKSAKEQRPTAITDNSQAAKVWRGNVPLFETLGSHCA